MSTLTTRGTEVLITRSSNAIRIQLTIVQVNICHIGNCPVMLRNHHCWKIPIGPRIFKCRENFFCTNLYESFGKDVPNTSNSILVFFAKSKI